MIEYLYILFILSVLHGIYINNVKPNMFKMIKTIQNSEDPSIRKQPMALTYLLMAFGLYHFIIKGRKSKEDAFILGISIYGVYNLTNYTIFKNWDMSVLLTDTFWGGSLYALTTHITYRIIGIKKI